MATIYQTTAGRLWINHREFSIEDLVMGYETSLQDTTLVSIYSKTIPTGIDNVNLSSIKDDNGSGYVNVTAWVNWWAALETVGDITATIAGVATAANQETLLEKQFPTGIHILTGTDAATAGTYTGFYVLEDATISAITLTDATKVTGTNDFDGITLYAGTFLEIPGGFSTVTLSAGSMVLIKEA
jgi:hypothetical protein